MNVLVLQHIACEPPGVYEDVLREHSAAICRIELDEGESPPDWRHFDAIVAMGGPMGVNDEGEQPWLAQEKRLINEAVHAGMPFWGTCLGVQLLAASLGARVYQAPLPEVGLMPVFLTEAAAEDPVFADLSRDLLTLQWHGDTFDLPSGAVLLASSPICAHQAFRWGSVAYGVQFHLEVSPALAQEWAGVPVYEKYLDQTLGPGSLARLIKEIDESAALLESSARRLFERWLAAASHARG